MSEPESMNIVMEQQMSPLLSIAECQQLLGVSRSTIYRLIERQAISCVHIGRAVRIPSGDLKKFVEPSGGGASCHLGSGSTLSPTVRS